MDHITERTDRGYVGHAERRVSLRDLIRGGILRPGIAIELRTRNGKQQAVVTDDGDIRIGDRLFRSPTAAAKAVAGYQVDGWIKWRVPSSGDRLLVELRDQYLAEVNRN